MWLYKEDALLWVEEEVCLQQIAEVVAVAADTDLGYYSFAVAVVVAEEIICFVAKV